jgi:hypothetical protein
MVADLIPAHGGYTGKTPESGIFRKKMHFLRKFFPAGKRATDETLWEYSFFCRMVTLLGANIASDIRICLYLRKR